MARKIGLGVARVLLIVGGALLLLFGYFAAKMPKSDGPRVEANLHVVGVTSPDMYAWIIRTKNGAALVDTGMDTSGKAILDELAREGVNPGQVHTILLTHGHPDHIAAAALFKNAKVYVGKEDVALVKGDEKPAGLPGLFAKMTGPIPAPAELLPLNGGETLDVDGEQVKVIATPGHTGGSRMYLLGEVLFTGDSLQGGGREVSLPPSAFSKDPAQNRKSLEALVELPFTMIADGHTGATANAREKLKRFLAK